MALHLATFTSGAYARIASHRPVCKAVRIGSFKATSVAGVRIFLFTLAALACPLAGCRKAKNTPINQEMLKYLAYNAGSYWVYEDSATGRIDSFVVLSDARQTREEYQGDRWNTYDEYKVSIAWFNVTADTFVAATNWILRDNYVEWYCRFFDYSRYVRWPLFDGATAGDGLRVTGTREFDIPGQSGILCWRLHQSSIAVDTAFVTSQIEEDFYYNKYIGMVSMVMNIHTYTYKEKFTFKLLRYKI